MARATFPSGVGPLAPKSARKVREPLRELLAESTGRRFDVRPVVVFPGWFIEQTGQSTKKLWLLNPKALPRFLDNEGVRLSPEDIKLASYHLSRHIRSEEAKSA